MANRPNKINKLKINLSSIYQFQFVDMKTKYLARVTPTK